MKTCREDDEAKAPAAGLWFPSSCHAKIHLPGIVPSDCSWQGHEGRPISERHRTPLQGILAVGLCEPCQNFLKTGRLRSSLSPSQGLDQHWLDGSPSLLPLYFSSLAFTSINLLDDSSYLQLLRWPRQTPWMTQEKISIWDWPTNHPVGKEDVNLVDQWGMDSPESKVAGDSSVKDCINGNP